METDLANIAQIIPKDGNLKIKGGIIYDASNGVNGLNGSSDLPNGGYLGAGFLSSFNYTFYSPAPERMYDSYYYAKSVRYDIFGSALQANMMIKVNKHMSIQYVDIDGKEIRPPSNYLGFTDEKYKFTIPEVSNYRIVDVRTNIKDPNNPILQFVYHPEYKVKINFVDEKGKKIAQSKEFKELKNSLFRYEPADISGYTKPKGFYTVVNGQIEYTFKYNKNIEKKNKFKKHIYKKVSVIRKYDANIYINRNVKNNKNTNKNIIDKHKTNNVIVHKTAIDYFCYNTGLTELEKNTFINMINKEYNIAYDKITHGKKRNLTMAEKVELNRQIANKISAKAYENHPFESKVNDFEKVSYSKEDDVLNKLHDDKCGKKIDIPHGAVALATVYGNPMLDKYGTVDYYNVMIEVLKCGGAISYTHLFGIDYKENFLRLNSYTGDLFTTMNERDRLTDIDAYILYYHPEFKNLPLNEAYVKLYSIKDLDVLRSKLYDEAIEMNINKNINSSVNEAYVRDFDPYMSVKPDVESRKHIGEILTIVSPIGLVLILNELLKNPIGYILRKKKEIGDWLNKKSSEFSEWFGKVMANIGKGASDLFDYIFPTSYSAENNKLNVDQNSVKKIKAQSVEGKSKK